jgi:hypothetical protein
LLSMFAFSHCLLGNSSVRGFAAGRASEPPIVAEILERPITAFEK